MMCRICKHQYILVRTCIHQQSIFHRIYQHWKFVGVIKQLFNNSFFVCFKGADQTDVAYCVFNIIKGRSCDIWWM